MAEILAEFEPTSRLDRQFTRTAHPRDCHRRHRRPSNISAVSSGKMQFMKPMPKPFSPFCPSSRRDGACPDYRSQPWHGGIGLWVGGWLTHAFGHQYAHCWTCPPDARNLWLEPNPLGLWHIALLMRPKLYAANNQYSLQPIHMSPQATRCVASAANAYTSMPRLQRSHRHELCSLSILSRCHRTLLARRLACLSCPREISSLTMHDEQLVAQVIFEEGERHLWTVLDIAMTYLICDCCGNELGGGPRLYRMRVGMGCYTLWAETLAGREGLVTRNEHALHVGRMILRHPHRQSANIIQAWSRTHATLAHRLAAHHRNTPNTIWRWSKQDAWQK